MLEVAAEKAVNNNNIDLNRVMNDPTSGYSQISYSESITIPNLAKMGSEFEKIA